MIDTTSKSFILDCAKTELELAKLFFQITENFKSSRFYTSSWDEDLENILETGRNCYRNYQSYKEQAKLIKII